MPRLPTLLLLVCALSLRLTIPSGWMPAANVGAFAIEPCAAAAPQPMTMEHGKHHGSSHKSQHDGDCAFAPLSAGAAASDPAPLPATPRLEAEALPNHVQVPFFATGPPALPPPATGPPAIS